MKVSGLGQCSLDHLFIVDSYPAPDSKKEVIEMAVAGGGPVATALVSLSRLGVACRFYGITGDDEAGIKITGSLSSEGIDTGGILVRPGTESQIAYICVEQGSGQRTVFWKRPSADPMQSDELPGDFPRGSDFLLLDGLMPEVSAHAAARAREKDIPVMLDAGSMRSGMKDLAALCDYVVCSEGFARAFSASQAIFDPERAIVLMRQFGAQAVTITLGPGGSITLAGERIFRTPAFKVDVIDTTGAGDVFHGGYIYGLLRGWDIDRTVLFASAFAALKCRALGGRAGIPGLEETEALMAETHSLE